MTATLFHPVNWFNHGHWHYVNQTPGKAGKWNNVQYLINDLSVRESDFLVVHDDVDSTVTVKIPTGNAILVTGEEKSAKLYPQEFINQFDVVVTSRDDINHPQVIRTHYFHPWRIKKTYDELVQARPVKTKSLSAIVSDVTALPGHKTRFAFMNKMKGHFKDRLDWYSKGENTFIADKWDGLAPYNYSIAIENSTHENYFTEKLTDCFLAGTMPFYWGCPNIGSFFDDRSLLGIDVSDFPNAVEMMEMVLRERLHIQRRQYVLEAHELALKKYHFIAALTEVLNERTSAKTSAKKTIKPYRNFVNLTVLNRLKRAAGIIVKGNGWPTK